LAAEPRIFCAVNLAHAAASQGIDDAVMRYSFAQHSHQHRKQLMSSTQALTTIQQTARPLSGRKLFKNVKNAVPCRCPVPRCAGAGAENYCDTDEPCFELRTSIGQEGFFETNESTTRLRHRLPPQPLLSGSANVAAFLARVLLV
jgi:hypothetical protein